jgi:HAD superfamily hydrolase (TIGR01549 family)
MQRTCSHHIKDLTLHTRKLPPKLLKAVIFDIGRVIVRLNLKRALTRLNSSHAVGGVLERSHERIWTAIQGDPHWRDWQEGRMTPQEWHEHITRQFRVVMSFEEFCAMWNSSLEARTILPDDLFKQLGGRFRLGLLSNTDPIHRTYLETHFSFVRYFQAKIYSNEVGMSKPSPAIYQAALAALGVIPAEALYIDDVAEYVDAARQLGLDAIHFQNPRQLARELTRREVPFSM